MVSRYEKVYEVYYIDKLLNKIVCYIETIVTDIRRINELTKIP